MTPAQADLLHRCRRMIADLDEQIASLRSAAIRFLRGAVDATGEAIDRAELQAMVDRNDPEGLTRLEA